MSTTPYVSDVDTASFDAAVLERSRTVPVVVDLWAEWCGPCRTLGPMLESAVSLRGGAVELVKVDVDANPSLAQRYQVRGIPHVLGFRDGELVSSFTGAVPPDRIEAFLDALVPSEADRLVVAARSLPRTEAIAELRTALELDPSHRQAAIDLATLLVDDDPDAAVELVRSHRPDPDAEAVVSRAELARDADHDLDDLAAQVAAGETDPEVVLPYARGLAARGDHDRAIDVLLRTVEEGGDGREPARAQLVSLFGLLGDDDDRVVEGRRRLARALF